MFLNLSYIKNLYLAAFITCLFNIPWTKFHYKGHESEFGKQRQEESFLRRKRKQCLNCMAYIPTEGAG